MPLFDLFKSPQDESESLQLESFKKEPIFAWFSSFGIEVPAGCDSIPNASGPFGLSRENPVPVNGLRGARIFLNRLQVKSGRAVFYHRVASHTQGNPSGFPVDQYQIVGADGSQKMSIFLCPYFPRRSLQAPKGLHVIPWTKIAKDKGIRFIVFNGAFGSVEGTIPDFPYGLPDYIRKKFGSNPGDFGESMARSMKLLLDEFWADRNVAPPTGTKQLPTPVTREWVEQMQKDGRIEAIKGEIVKVHMLSPTTNYTIEYWSVGDEVSTENYQKFKDPDSGELYALTVFREGETELYLMQKASWNEAKTNFD